MRTAVHDSDGQCLHQRQGVRVLDAATGQCRAKPAPELESPVRLKQPALRRTSSSLGGLTLMRPIRRTLRAAQGPVQVARNKCAAGALAASLCQLDGLREEGAHRSAPRGRSSSIRRTQRKTTNRGHRHHPSRADQTSRWPAGRAFQRADAVGVQKPQPTAIASIDNRLALWSTAQNALYWLSSSRCCCSQPSIGDHVRRDGRHQQAHRRDGDSRRLHDFRGAATPPAKGHHSLDAAERLHPLPFEYSVWLVVAYRAAARIPCRSAVGILIERR